MHTISEKYNITPSAGLLLFPNDKEEDDDLHDPTTGVNDRECDIFTKRGLVNVGGLALISVGILVLFIGYPILTFVQKFTAQKTDDACAGGLCLNVPSKALLKNVRTGLIDDDTPDDAMTRKNSAGKTYKLVFSDEFNEDGRTFYPDDDPYWEAVNIHYAATQDLEWYLPEMITTKDGYLEISFDAFQTHGLDYRSGMLQGWNHMCFKGGILEASISLPGRGNVSGLWPGFWVMGNLGRPGYTATTDGMWPYSYDHICDAGITANQSSNDGISYLPGMRLPACTCSGQDHPNQGKSRSAPEIDAIEASVGKINPAGDTVGTASQSAQIAPFDLWYNPNYDHMAIFNPEHTSINAYRGGTYQEAISGVTILNNDWYDNNAYQTYGFDYTPGSKGSIRWNVGSMDTWKIEAAALGPNGNIGQRTIPEEPMAMVMNLGMGESFAYVDYNALTPLLPVKMRIDWVRVWQDPDCENCSVGCDPPDFPTTNYIKEHRNAYDNFNLTSWGGAGHDWPKNTLVDGCSL